LAEPTKPGPRLYEEIRRQTLYREFIEDAAKCYINALQHDKAAIPNLISFMPS
jgi:hypothetical protein